MGFCEGGCSPYYHITSPAINVPQIPNPAINVPQITDLVANLFWIRLSGVGSSAHFSYFALTEMGFLSAGCVASFWRFWRFWIRLSGVGSRQLSSFFVFGLYGDGLFLAWAWERSSGMFFGNVLRECSSAISGMFFGSVPRECSSGMFFGDSSVVTWQETPQFQTRQDIRRNLRHKRGL